MLPQLSPWFEAQIKQELEKGCKKYYCPTNNFVPEIDSKIDTDIPVDLGTEIRNSPTSSQNPYSTKIADLSVSVHVADKETE
jgi:hypothetical protein